MLAEAGKYLAFVSVCFVEKIVDFFRDSVEENQNSPLAKQRSFLLYKATPYLSMTIEGPFASFGGAPCLWFQV
ncbi:MAG: hypothetical protein ABSC76_06655 [Terracidiphilus sp.]|jgi:hypothetical protein